MIPTAGELALIRTHPHETELWLSIYKPMTILSVQLNNASAAPGDRIIPYDNLFSGWYTSVESGMTMYVGTTPGAKDRGRVRVRSATDHDITVAENSDIEWEDNLFLTVVNFFEIDAIFPRITQTGTNTYWYKDYDIEYTNQNDNLGTFICMGSHYAGFIDPDLGYAQVYYNDTGSYNVLNTPFASTEWYFQGATQTGSFSHFPGNINYTVPGHYTTRLKVTDDNGMVDISYRHISIYNRPGRGANVPILNWKLTSLSGDRENGGWTARITVRDDVSDIDDGALVIIFADDRYGTTKQSIGGNGLNRDNIVFVGYIVDGSISYNYQTSSIEFDVGSPTEIMKLTSGISVATDTSSDPSVQAANDPNYPSGWVLVRDMDCRRAIYHYLRWHSTVLLTTDFQFMGTDQSIANFDADRMSIYDGLQGLMKGTLYGDAVCDRQGKLWAEVGIAVTDGAISGSFPNIMVLDNQDWMGTPVIDEVLNPEVGYIEVGGIAYHNESGTFDAYMCGTPGYVPAYHGKIERLQGLALSSQAQLNLLAGNMFAYRNARYPALDLMLVGNYRIIDIAPQETIKVSLAAGDTPRGIVWNQKLFHPTSMSWQYDPSKGTFLPNLTLHEVTQGFPATTIVIPPVPPTEDEDGGGFDVPPIYIPPPVIPSLGILRIYHNGQFVAAVAGINFIDDC